MSNPIVEIRELTRRYGEKLALDAVDLVAEEKGVVGIVGENGAGKTTLIKHMLGLLRAQSGTVRVFGLDPVEHPEKVLARIGYLSEDPELPAWMTVGELLNYTSAFYPSWDRDYADELIESFKLDRGKKTKDLSRGQKARAGLVAAQAHRPDLLLLDEPSSGLDPIVRRDILAAIIRGVRREGRTVIFSSHLLHEVESVCDRIVMVSQGKIVLSDGLDEILRSHRHLTFEGSGGASSPNFDGVISAHRDGGQWVAIGSGEEEDLLAHARAAGLNAAAVRTPTLDEIFVARSGVNPLADAEEESFALDD
jgi:ABC-2 type transport system ATP-binding protein